VAITRANVEVVLCKRLGPLLTAAGMATTCVGSNADLNDPIGWAIRQADYTVASIALVADADLVGVASDDYDQVLDLAEYRMLETIQGNLDDVDVQVGPRREALSQLADQVQQKLERLEARIGRLYGVGLASLEAGYLTMNFAEHDDGTSMVEE